MYHTTIGLLVLEVQEPVFTIFCMHPATLMRAVDISLTLLEHNLMFVRTIGRLRTHSQLETLGNTASRTHNPIPAIALVELRTFAGAVLSTVSVEHDDGLPNSLRTVSAHLANS